jgi:hypothetical protein
MLALAGMNSLGSYFSPKFSSLLESSSKTDLLARTDLTMSDGWISLGSRSNSLCLVLRVEGSSFVRLFLEPDHFSYFSSRERSLSSHSGEGGEGSESDDEE